MLPDSHYTLAGLIESEDLSGAAKLFLLSEDINTLKNLPEDSPFTVDPTLLESVINSDRLNFNYLLESINYTFIEHARLEPHMGDQFSHYFFGESPLVLNISGKVLTTEGGFDKFALTTAYRDVFRLYQVARINITPCLSFKNTTTQGAMLSLSIQESSSQEDVLNIAFEWLAYNAYITAESNNLGLTTISWALSNSTETTEGPGA